MTANADLWRSLYFLYATHLSVRDEFISTCFTLSTSSWFRLLVQLISVLLCKWILFCHILLYISCLGLFLPVWLFTIHVSHLLIFFLSLVLFRVFFFSNLTVKCFCLWPHPGWTAKMWHMYNFLHTPVLSWEPVTMVSVGWQLTPWQCSSFNTSCILIYLLQ